VGGASFLPLIDVELAVCCDMLTHPSACVSGFSELVSPLFLRPMC
jgi:hypothetical protein